MITVFEILSLCYETISWEVFTDTSLIESAEPKIFSGFGFFSILKPDIPDSLLSKYFRELSEI